MKVTLVYTIILLSLLSGCSSGETKASELLETARFEEKQNNYEHASQLYKEILAAHPKSAAAKSAALRLEELSKK